MIMVNSAPVSLERRHTVAVVVTVAKGYDLGYVWKNQGQQERAAEKGVGGYYLNAAQHGEPPGRWWGRVQRRSDCLRARSLSGNPITRSTSSFTQSPGRNSAGPEAATCGSPITWVA